MIIANLSNAMGISGNEFEIRSLLYKLAKKYADSIKIDVMGNIIAYKKGAKSKRKLMIAAHMDEVGFVITGIDDKGFLKIARVGGIDPRICVDKRVVVGRDKIPGVITSKPIHLLNKSERDKIVPFSSLLVDIGAKDKNEVKKYVKLGDSIVFDTIFEKLNQKIIKGKALDDRLGCYIVLELLKKEHKDDLYAVFTVQEEVGLRGANVAAYSIMPDYAVILEATGAQDFPNKKDINISPELGKGTCITIKDGNSFASPELLDMSIKLADKHNIPYQFKKTGVGGTDAGVIQIAGKGVKTIIFATPARYIHSPVSISSMNDVRSTFRLADVLLNNIK